MRHQVEDFCDQRPPPSRACSTAPLATVHAAREKLQATAPPPPEPEHDDLAGVEDSLAQHRGLRRVLLTRTSSAAARRPLRVGVTEPSVTPGPASTSSASSPLSTRRPRRRRQPGRPRGRRRRRPGARVPARHGRGRR